MAYTSAKKCPKCNTLSMIVHSNNDMVVGLCTDCLSKVVNVKDLNSADKFCRTFNYPFDPNK